MFRLRRSWTLSDRLIPPQAPPDALVLEAYGEPLGARCVSLSQRHERGSFADLTCVRWSSDSPAEVRIIPRRVLDTSVIASTFFYYKRRVNGNTAWGEGAEIAALGEDEMLQHTRGK